jgi:hypothetical protein
MQGFLRSADSERFELPEVLPPLVFKTNAIGRSANYPLYDAVSIVSKEYIGCIMIETATPKN